MLCFYRILTVLIVLLLSQLFCTAQFVTVTNYDNSHYPAMKANFMVIDKDSKPIKNISANDISILENGEKVDVGEISCPQETKLLDLSAVLTIDVSGSMTGANLNMAKSAAKAWVNCMIGNSDCAVTAFDLSNYFIQDFTSDKNKLTKAIDDLSIRGGTDYDAALFNPQAGSVLAASHGKYKRVVVLLTDGQGMATKLPEILDSASKNLITIYCVCIKLKAPDCLEEIARKTGGQCFSYVNSEQEAIDIYKRISFLEVNLNPCTVNWISQNKCNTGTFDVQFTYNPLGLKTNFIYTIDKEFIPRIVLNPPIIRFRDIDTINGIDTTFEIIALKKAFKITRISSDDSTFQVNSESFDLQADERKSIHIKYKPSERKNKFARIKVETDQCDETEFVSSCYSLKDKTESKFKILFPNGEELFAAGADTVIKWVGVLPDDRIVLEFSPNNGAKWERITDTASAFKFNWTKLPNLSSKNCLIKGTKNMEDQLDTTIFGNGYINQMIYNRARNLFALVRVDKYVNIWDNFSFEEKTIKCKEKVIRLAFSMDGSQIGLLFSKNVSVYDVTTGSLIQDIILPNNYSTSLCFSDDNYELAIGNSSGKISLYDIGSKNLIDTLKDQSSIIDMSYNSADKLLYTINDYGEVKSWKTGSKIPEHVSSPCGYSGNNCNFNISPKGDYSSNITIFNNLFVLKTDSLYKVPNFPQYVDDNATMAFSADGSKFIIGDSKIITIYETTKWKVIQKDTLHQLPTSIKYIFGEIDKGGFYILDNFYNQYFLDLVTYDLVYKNTFKSDESVFSVSTTRDFNSLAIGRRSSSIDIYDLNTKLLKKVISNKDLPESLEITSMDISPSGKYLAIGCMSAAYFWDLEADTLLNKIDLINGVSAMTFFDTDSLVAYGYGGSTKIYDFYKGMEIKAFSDLDATSIYCLSVNPPLNQIAQSNNQKINIWDYKSEKKVYSETTESGTLSIKYSRNHDLLAYQAKKNEIEVLDPVTFKKIHIIPTKFRIAYSIDISPSNNFLAIGGDSAISIVDMITGKELRYLEGHTSIVRSLKYGEDDNILFSGGEDGLAIKWNLDNKDISISDQSDKCFEIVKSNLISTDIDMGTIGFGSMKDSVISQYMFNPNLIDCRIKEMRITGAGANNFNLVSERKDFAVQKNSAKDIEIEFNPKTVGEVNAVLEIVTPDTTYRRNIKGISLHTTIDISDRLINFGKVIIGMEKDTVAEVVHNLSQLKIEFEQPLLNGPDNVQFIIDSGGSKFTMSPGGNYKMKLRFKPEDIGRTSGSLKLAYDQYGSPAMVGLYAEALPVPRPKVIANNPLCQGDDLIMIADTNAGVSYHWIGPDRSEYDGGSLRINNAQPWHSGRYIVFANVKNYWSDTMAIDVYVNTRYIYPADSALKLTDSASRQGNSFLLTDAKPWQSGAVWLKYKFTLDNDFISSFKFKVSKGNNGKGYDNSEPGGDGFAFVIRKDYGEIMGSKGESIGYGGIPSSMAIEIDLHKNYYDINGNHIAVLCNKDRPNSPVHDSLNTYANNPNIPIIHDDELFYVKIVYNSKPHNLFVYLGKDTMFINPVVQILNLDLRQLLGIDKSGFAFIGLTASTGDAYEQHWIYDWVIPCSAEILDVEQRDDNSINIYPNPAHDYVNLRSDANAEIIYSIALCNVLGETVMQFRVPDGGIMPNQLTIKDIAAGVYYLKIQTGRGTKVKILEIK